MDFSACLKYHPTHEEMKEEKKVCKFLFMLLVFDQNFLQHLHLVLALNMKRQRKEKMKKK